MLRPLRNNIIVRRIPDPEQHWLIPDSMRPQSQRGEVVAVGRDNDLKPGEIVVFSPCSSQHPFNDHKFMKSDDLLVLSEMDVLGVIE